MKTEFLKTVKLLFRLFVTFLAFVFSAIALLSRRASYYLTRLLVDRQTRDLFDGKRPPDYRQKLHDLLGSEGEPFVGFIREMIEKTQPGQLAARHVSERHDYAVLNPNKQENIRRILNAFDAFPKAAHENCYTVIERAINDFHYSEESQDEETSL